MPTTALTDDDLFDVSIRASHAAAARAPARRRHPHDDTRLWPARVNPASAHVWRAWLDEVTELVDVVQGIALGGE